MKFSGETSRPNPLQTPELNLTRGVLAEQAARYETVSL